MLYFAYGSNLHLAQMLARCPGASIVGRAVLPHHELTFAGWNTRWEGGVATVRPRDGVHVQGLLYQLDADDLARLDAFEGWPHVYDRRLRFVLDAEGQRRRAFVYHQPEHAPSAAPGPGYLALIERAYDEHGFERALLESATLLAAPALRRVFVYGTLLQGERNHHLLRTARFVKEARTEARFRLYHLGHFPGMVAGGRTAIEGEVYEVDTRTLTALDRLEGHPDFYARQRIVLDGGGEAETYLLPLDRVKGMAVIRSGSWRSR